MRMFRWKNENTRKDMIQGGEICLKMRVAPIYEKKMKSHLRWFSHMQQRATKAPVKKCELIQVEGMKKCNEKPKIILVEIIKQDMSIKEAIKSMILGRVELCELNLQICVHSSKKFVR